MATIDDIISSVDDFLIDGARVPGGSSQRKKELEAGTMENNIYGTGYVSLQWRSNDSTVIPKGTELVVDEHHFVLGQPYVPTSNGDGTWTYSPKFGTIGERLGKLPFYFETQAIGTDGQSDDIRLRTFPFSGTAAEIVGYIDGVAQNGGAHVSLGDQSLGSQTVFVSFDNDSIQSAAQKVASALGAQTIIDEMNITIKVYRAVAEEGYEQFQILGGTRNMAKKTLTTSSSYSAITQRLMLPPEYVDSVYDPSSAGGQSGEGLASGKTTLTLIFDDIYPALELSIANVHERRCYMTDENGQRVIYGYEFTDETMTGEPVFDHKETDIEGVVHYYDAQDNELTPKYKTYSKWYVSLGFARQRGDGTSYYIRPDGGEVEKQEGTDIGGGYAIPSSSIIAGKPLGILFQSGILMGREFDLASFTDDITHEKMDDDMEDGATIGAGAYRIIMQADGSTLIPSSSTENGGGGLVPHVGDKVTLINVAMDSQYFLEAQQRLLERAKEVVPMYIITDNPVEEEYEQNDIVDDFLEEGIVPIVVPGEPPSFPQRRNMAPSLRSSSAGDANIVTSVRKDLVSGRISYTTGTFRPQGIVSSMIDKIDGVSLSGGAATMGSVEEYYRPTASMGIDQFLALQQAGGGLAHGSAVKNLKETLDDVKEQTDRKLDIWFGHGQPLPNTDYPNAQANEPANDWGTTALKAQHVHDIYYDMDKPAGSQGGRAWRWSELTGSVQDESTVFLWEEILDADTIASLEKIADVASDGILSGGAEKGRVYVEWQKAVSDYNKYYEQANDYYDATSQTYIVSGLGTALTNYTNAILALYQELNGGVAPTDTSDLETTPAWLADITVDTVIGTTQQDKDAYRSAWSNYYAAQAAIIKQITAATKKVGENAQDAADQANQAVEEIVDDGYLDGSEKQAVKREFISLYHEMTDNNDAAGSTMCAGILDMAMDENDHWIIDYATYISPYIAAFNAVGTALNGGTPWSVPGLTATSTGASVIVDSLTEYYMPDWIQDLNMSDTQPFYEKDSSVSVSKSDFRDAWADLAAKRTAVLTALTDHAATMAELSHTQVFVGVFKNTLSAGEDADDYMPTPDYRLGDVWIRLAQASDSTGPMYLCINGRARGTAPQESDWKCFSENADPRNLLKRLALALWDDSNKKAAIKALTSDNYLPVTISASTQETGDVGNAITALYAVIGATTVKVFNDKTTSTPNSGYSLRITEIAYHDANMPQGAAYDQYRNVPLGISVEGCIAEEGNGGWELLHESTKNIADFDIPGYMRAIVANNTNAAGVITTSNLVKMFATQIDPNDPNSPTIAEAYFGMSIEYDPVTGEAYSLGKMSADRLEFEGKTVINGKFTVDQYGNVTMNDATMNNTSVLGTLQNTSTEGNVEINNGLIVISSNASDNQSKIRFGIDNGYPVMQYFDENGNMLYDLGPGGLSSMSARTARCLEEHYKAAGNSLSTIIDNITSLFSVAQTDAILYYFLCKINVGQRSADEVYVDNQNDVADLNECYYTALDSSVPKIKRTNKASGFYYVPTAAAFGNPGNTIKLWNGSNGAPSDYSTNVSYYQSDYTIDDWPSDPNEIQTKPILYMEVLEFSQGKFIRAHKVFMKKDVYDSLFVNQ